MSNYAYMAVDAHGVKAHGTLEVADQEEALRRLRQMGLFPTNISPRATRRRGPSAQSQRAGAGKLGRVLWRPAGRVKAGRLAVFTRQLATLVEAGMPLLRGLRILHQQEENRKLKSVIDYLAATVEGGGTLSEAAGAHPGVFSRLYLNMVKAGELSGALDTTLSRLAEFLEKAERIKSKVKAAMFYPVAVLIVACGILGLLMVYVVPRFRLVFDGLLPGAGLPVFTMFVFRLSEAVAHHAVWLALGAAGAWIGFSLVRRTQAGRLLVDRLKLHLPLVGPLFRKLAISRFSRTLGTLMSNGVPVLQALAIVRETAGNVVVGNLISAVHENVKQGEPIASTLKGSEVFPAMVAGMVDVGEQTGALPEMLMRVADTYDDEVDHATSALTSLLEPILIVFLAVVVGSIVIAMFLPILKVMDDFNGSGSGRNGD